MKTQNDNLSLLHTGAAQAVPDISALPNGMPHKLRWLAVKFQGPLHKDEIPAFRGAVNALVGRHSDLFHNHSDNGKTLRRYPRIQYKRVGMFPLIVCLDEGADAIHHLLAQRPAVLNLNGRPMDFGVLKLEMKETPLRVWNRSFEYRLRRWIPLTDESYGRYVHDLGMVERMALLEKKLTNHIVALWRDLVGPPDGQISVQLTEVYSQRTESFKGMPVLAFDVRFRCNVHLPDFVGLGKGASLGFGTLKMVEGQRL